MSKFIYILPVIIILMYKGVSVTRGIRNNNAGNIRLSGDKWLGLRDTQTDSAFFQFTTPEYGIRAMGKLLLNYQRLYGLNTVSGIINRWAPSIENVTTSYVSHVASLMGVGINDTINLSDSDTLLKLVKGIIKHENGINPYSDHTINAGLSLI